MICTSGAWLEMTIGTPFITSSWVRANSFTSANFVDNFGFMGNFGSGFDPFSIAALYMNIVVLQLIDQMLNEIHKAQASAALNTFPLPDQTSPDANTAPLASNLPLLSDELLPLANSLVLTSAELLPLANSLPLTSNEFLPLS